MNEEEGLENNKKNKNGTYEKKQTLLLKMELVFGYLMSVVLWTLLSWGYYDEYNKNNLFMVIFVIFTVFAVVYGNEFKHIRKLNEQLVAVFIHPLILSIAIMLSVKSNINYDGSLVYVVFSLLPFAFYLLWCAAILFVNKQTDIASWVDKNKYVLLVITAAILLRLPNISMMQRWDSGEYYWRFSQAVQDFTFTNFTEYMKLFCLCNHPTMMFSLIYLPGELLFPEKIIGVSIISYIFTAIALWCMYRIILRCVKGTSEKSAAIYTALISFAPLFYGTTTYFNPDYAMACFFIITLYAFIYNKPVVAGVASLMCFQTKETGIVIVFGLVVGTFIRYICSGRTKDKSVIARIATDGCLYTTLISTVLQLVYMKTIGGVSNWTQYGEEPAGLVWDNNGTNCLGFNVPYIITKLKQQFVLNFNWMFTLFIILGIIVLVIYCARDKRNKEKNEYIHCMISAFVAFVVFSCLYITAPMARYNVVGDVLLYMIAMYIIERVVKVTRFRKKVTPIRVSQVIIGVLVLIECYVTIDPFTILGFKMLDAGGPVICYTGNKNIADEDMFYGDYLVYNTQYTYIDKAYDYVLKKTGYDTSWDIIIPTSNGNFINGNMYRLNWDEVERKRVFYTNLNTAPMNDYKLVERLHIDERGLADKAVLIINPYYRGIDQQEMLDETLNYYTCVDQGAYRSLQGNIYYYVLEK